MMNGVWLRLSQEKLHNMVDIFAQRKYNVQIKEKKKKDGVYIIIQQGL